jgi:hypothetical protein
MPKFEFLLAAYLLTLSAGCGEMDQGETCSATPTEDEASIGDLVRSVGFVSVEPGAECPAVEVVTELYSEQCCPDRVFTGPVCEALGRVDGQVSTYSTYQPADTETSEVVDICLYEGLFKLTGGCCGRPLLHEGAPMVAHLARAASWGAGEVPDTGGLPVRERMELGEHWLRAALLEHASVASFARFTLELLRWGAPPTLVAQAQRAALDEVEHARRCFALAGAYLGQPLGPAEMALGDAVALSPTFADFVEAVVREGCVGETLSVLEAAGRLQHETDPVVCAVLQQIVADESRHAALAWDTVQWALQRDPSLVSRLERVFAQERAGSAERFPEGWERVIAPAWVLAYRGARRSSWEEQ